MRIEPLEEKYEKFLNDASRHLNINKWGDFLLRWAKALETYGTPLDFIEGITYDTDVKENFNGKDWPVSWFRAGKGWIMRNELIENQKRHPFIPAKQNLEEYGLRLSPTGKKCFMCENIVQGIDARDNPSIDNVIFDLGDYFITPGRYPRQPGHCLWVPINHDDDTTRVTPIENGFVYIPEQGRTRGAIITPKELGDLIAACEKYHFVAHRNHVLDAMSIPAHDHWHLHPADLPDYTYAGHVMNEASLILEKGIFIPKNTPFDSLVITHDTDGNFSELACYILGNMERDNQVFTLVYYKDRLSISPRQNILDHRRIQIGAGIQIHMFDDPNPGCNERIIKHVPMRGEYPWIKYIE
jgi:hypothetical protein